MDTAEISITVGGQEVPDEVKKWFLQNLIAQETIEIKINGVPVGEKGARAFIEFCFEDYSDQEMAQILRTAVQKVGVIRRRSNGYRFRRSNKTSTLATLAGWCLHLLINIGGWNGQEVAEALGVSREAINQLMHVLGVPNDRDPAWFAHHYHCPNLADYDWLKDNYLQRGSGSIADELGLSKVIVEGQLRRYGIISDNLDIKNIKGMPDPFELSSMIGSH